MRRLQWIATTCYGCYIAGMERRTITQRELRNDSGAILREVQAGYSVVVTRNGEPVAELRPIGPRHFVPRAVIAAAAARAPRVDRAQFRRDVDRVVDPSVRG
jgi:prevent-host-death family protein